MGRGLKRSLRTVHGLACRQEHYGFNLQEALTVRSAAQVKRHDCGTAWTPGLKSMISFSGSPKIFLFVDCCDMRDGFNGLRRDRLV